MAVSIKQTSDVAAVITVQVSAADYQPQVDKALKNYQKNASIPGFRKGHAPLGLIKKQVGTSVKVEEINRADRQRPLRLYRRREAPDPRQSPARRGR